MSTVTDERRIFLHRVEMERTVQLSLHGRPLLRVEKNWMPFVVDGELRFVYRVDPLTVIRCVDLDRGECEVLYDEAPDIESVHGRSGGEVHGGTELELWRWPLYVGFLSYRPMAA